MRKLIGAGVELRVAHLLGGEDQCRSLRRGAHLSFDQAVQAVLAGEVCGCGVPAVENLLPFSPVEHQHFGDPLRGIGADGLQQGQPVPGHALDGARVEQRCRVGQASAQATVMFSSVQGQVELRRVTVRQQCLDLQTGQRADIGAGLALVIEHHLKQRAVAEAALWLQGFDQLLEGQLLMRLGLQGGVFDLLQQLVERRVHVKLGTQHLRVDEEADQAFGFSAVAVGNRHADTNVRLTAVTVQQALE